MAFRNHICLQVMRSTGRYVRIVFQSYNRNHIQGNTADGFSLVYSAFHTSDCDADSFRCRNGHCIKKSLVCDGWDNCEDERWVCSSWCKEIVNLGHQICLPIIFGKLLLGCLSDRRPCRTECRGEIPSVHLHVPSQRLAQASLKQGQAAQGLTQASHRQSQAGQAGFLASYSS